MRAQNTLGMFYARPETTDPEEVCYGLHELSCGVTCTYIHTHTHTQSFHWHSLAAENGHFESMG